MKIGTSHVKYSSIIQQVRGLKDYKSIGLHLNSLYIQFCESLIDQCTTECMQCCGGHMYNILHSCLRKQVKFAEITLTMVYMVKSLSMYDKVITDGIHSNNTLEMWPLKFVNKISHM